MSQLTRVGCYNRRIVLAKSNEISYEKFFTPIIKPQCRDCRYSQKQDNNSMTCSLFKDFNYYYYINTKDARDDNNLCGPDAYYFKNKK
jgi:hypothetical protein